MTSRNENVTGPSGEDAFSRRKFLTVASAGVAGTVVTGRAVADTLADVPPREVGADVSVHGERSKFVHLSMLPEAGPGEGTLCPIYALTIEACLGLVVGGSTCTALRWERWH